MSFAGVAGPPQPSTDTATGGRGPLQGPHSAAGTGEADGEHTRYRVLAVKLDLRDKDDVYRRFQELSRHASHYANHHLLARWVTLEGYCVDPKKNIPNDVTKKARAERKGDLSGAAYSAIERETAAAWKLWLKRGAGNGPLPMRKPTSALLVRGHQNRKESGVRLSEGKEGQILAELQVQNAHSEGGSWIAVPLAMGTAKDYQIELIRRMVSWEIPILKAALVIHPVRRRVLLRLSYALKTPLPRFGNRTATLGPIGPIALEDGTKKPGRLFLRTECDTLDYSDRLHTLLARKDEWDLIRRRVCAQIGRSKGAARKKRIVLSRLSWESWLDTFLHTWSRQMMRWLSGQGIAALTVTGLETDDWPAYKFVNLLTWKGEEYGITVKQQADLAESGTERAVKQEVQRKRRRATKQAKALRELSYQNSAGAAGD